MIIPTGVSLSIAVGAKDALVSLAEMDDDTVVVVETIVDGVAAVIDVDVVVVSVVVVVSDGVGVVVVVADVVSVVVVVSEDVTVVVVVTDVVGVVVLVSEDVGVVVVVADVVSVVVVVPVVVAVVVADEDTVVVAVKGNGSSRSTSWNSPGGQVPRPSNRTPGCVAGSCSHFSEVLLNAHKYANDISNVICPDGGTVTLNATVTF